MKAVILMPFRAGGDDRRQQLWDWTRYFLERDIGWPIYEGDDGGDVFSRAGSINDAAAKAGDWTVALIGDADTVQEAGPCIRAAEVALRENSVVVPWSNRWKLSQRGTLRFVQGFPVGSQHTDPRDHTSPRGGGATIVVSREAFEHLGGFDERFRGYGNEDLAFQAAYETLMNQGRYWTQVEGTVWHLWHRPAPHVGTARAATIGNQRLWTAYGRAKGKPDRMRGLLADRDAARAGVFI